MLQNIDNIYENDYNKNVNKQNRFGKGVVIYMYSINDIARITGYAKSSVSAAINNKPGVSEATRKKILEVCKELNYTPNEIAKSISNGSSKTIGIIVRDITNPFYAKLCRAVEKICEANGYTTLIFNTDGKEDRLKNAIRQAVGRRVDGVILDVSSHNENAIKNLDHHNIKTVIFGLQSENYDSVSCDDIEGSYDLIKSVSMEKANKIAYFCPSFNRNIYSKRRYEGISKYISQNPECELEVVDFKGSSSIENGYNLMNNYLKSDKKLPNVIMAFNDLIAVGVIRCLQEHKIKVPEDIIVTGFDNLETILFPLDTVDIPVYNMGIKATELLFKRLKNPEKELEHIVLDAKIVLR